LGASALAPLADDADAPFAASFLNPLAGGSFAILYQPDQGALMGAASLVINMDNRTIVPVGQEDPNLASGAGDQMVIGGALAGGLALGGAAAGHEQLVFLAGSDYRIVASDGDVVAGHTLAVIASTLGTGDSLDFDGSAEHDGRYDIQGGHGADHLTGGDGNDLLYGGGGGDTLAGGGGADIFHYDAVSESTGAGYDTLVGFDYGQDKIDLPGSVTGLDAALGHGALSTASFDADLSAAFGAAALGAGHAAFFTPDSGDLAGQTFLVVDGNGVAGYQPGLDFVFHVTAPPPPDLGGVAFFV
jgi:Ca2+-binding RTX toxin-like protein